MSIYDSRPDTQAHIDRVWLLMEFMRSHLAQRAEVHDASKLAEPELSIFNEYTPKLKHSTYGSDEYKGFLDGMGEALKHHYAHNSHHPEHYPDGIRGMDLLDLVEMFCDWKAATERHADGDLTRSINLNQERFGYSDDLKAILLNSVALFTPETGGLSAQKA